MVRGTLIGSFNDKGFAFIGSDSDAGLSDDVFLHIGQIASGEDARLYVRGAAVEFDVVMVTRGAVDKPQARNCRLLLGDSGVARALSSTGTSGRRGTLKFWSPLGFGFLVDRESGEEVYARSDTVPGGYLREGDEIEFDIHVTGARRQALNVRQTGWAATGDTFSDVLDLGSPKWTLQLAALAEPEPWNYQEKPSKDEHTVLRSYLKYTFLRLEELHGYLVEAADGSHMSFNTGLVTPFQEQIFALFRRRPDSDAGPPWLFRSFEKASSFTFLTLFGGSFPPLAWYFDEPSQLVYYGEQQIARCNTMVTVRACVSVILVV